MGRTAVFNGVELVIPDAYSALDVTRLLTPTSGGVGIVALVGEAEGGKPGINIFPGGTSPAVIKRELKSGPLADSCRLALRSGTDPLVQAGASTVVAFKTNNSTQSTLPIGGLSNAVAEIFTAQFVADVADSLDGTGFVVELQDGTTEGFYFNTNSSGTAAPADVLAADNQTLIDIPTGETAINVAIAAAAAMNGVAGLTVPVPTTDTATVTQAVAGAVANPPVNDSGAGAGVTFAVTTPGVDADSIATIELFTSQYGLFTELYTGEIVTVGSEKFLTVRDENGTPETSPGLGAVSYLNLEYTGDASTAVAQLRWVSNALRLQVTLAGDQTDGSADIDLDVTGLTVGNIEQVVGGLTGYAVTVDPARQQFAASDLDLYLTDQDITVTGGVDFPASIKELQDWAQTTSVLLEKVERGAENEAESVPGSLASSQFSGGTAGTTSNSTHQAALNELLKLRVNILVPLFSSDNQDGSTVTVSSINAQVKDHVQTRSSILGRSECQAYVSISGNKDAFKTECASLNSRWVACTSQIINDLDIDGTLKDFPEWGFAVVCAQTQAGSPIGTDLTYRALPVTGIKQDVSWSPEENGPELIKAGALIGGADEDNVNRIIAGYTTWLADDNNANIFIETVESLAIFAFNHRRFMKQRFLGQSDFTRQDIVDAIAQSVEVERDTTRSIKNFDLEQTSIIQASAGRLEYEVAVQPFEGIKFVLPTVVGIREVA